MVRRLVHYLDQRVGGSPAIKAALEYVFPDHWSFMIGEIALYAFIVLVGTGIFLTFFYIPSQSLSHYEGSYAPLHGALVSDAYKSVLAISLKVPAGLLIRQTHHWAADVFVASIVLHLLRVFFTGAFRKPRDVNWWVGLAILGLALPEGFFGYSLIDDLLSGMGLAIAYGVGMSVPIIGANATFLFFDGQFPGGSALFPRMFIMHVLIIPVTIAALIGIHLAILARQHHSQFAGPGRTERNVVGTPTWPGYALRSIGLLLVVAGLLFLLGGLVQINPIWEWGPYHTYISTNGAQPDWYLGWLIGGMRLMFAWEPHFLGATWIPEPFWGGALFPTVVFAFLFAWPAIERRLTGDYRRHDLLQRPRDYPLRTAVGMGVLAWVAIVFFAGSDDRIYYRLNVPYEGQIWFWRFGSIVVPLVVFLATLKVCRELKSSQRHPLRGWYGAVVRRTASGGYVAYDAYANGDDPSRIDTDPSKLPEPPKGSTLP